MYQIDVSTAATTQPASTALGTPGFFTDGNAATGVGATVVPAEFLNSVMLELANTVTGAGLPLSKSSFNQLYTAIQKIVKAGGLQASGVYVASSSQAIGAAQAGGTIVCNSATAMTLPLAASSSFPDGTRFEFINVNSGVVTITKQSGDIFAPSGQNPSSFTLNNGDSLVIETRGSVNLLYAVSGSVQLAYAGVFGANLAGSGYQKLPSGLIIQWGIASVPAGSSSAASTFPIAFPTACRSVVMNDGGVNGWTWSVQSLSATGFTAVKPPYYASSTSTNTSTTAALGSGPYIAIGY